MGRRIRYRPSAAAEQFVPVGKAQGDTLLGQKAVVIIVAGFVLLLAVFVGGAYFIMQNRKFQSEFAPLAGVCQGKWVGQASAYSSAAGLHPAVAVRDGSEGWQLDSYLIPGGVLPQSLGETQLVLCLGKSQAIYIQRCPYGEDTTVTNVIDRYYLQREARLIEAKTGRLIAVQTFKGSSPDYCNKKEWFGKDDKTVSVTGPDIPDSEIQSWASAHFSIK
ncbi:MAG: hypothetical protein Fur0044_03880 [Anaerolineae bacterium]|nr:hypothetical protein [Anaerolineales bacterium]MCQ3972248.1 hypothetical protein [Anaerolineae bacterium]